jgi:corrinoid protein of di/trimethylamine methyltransferase
MALEKDLLTQISESIVAGDPEATATMTEQALAAGVEPLAIIDHGLTPGMKTVGEKFSCGEYFIPHMIMSAKGMKRAMLLLEPELRARHQAIKSAGTVVIGTVKGDIHEIGKSLVATMLSASGFEVHDLGVDVSTERFIDTVKATGAGLLGLSSLLTTTMVMQKKVIEALEAAGLREQVKVMVGGAPVSSRWAAEIGADGYAEDVTGAVDLARRLSAAPTPCAT